jgi:collagenase-like PrtC family protease
MKPFLNVPFLPEERYVDFLMQCADDLDSVHFSLLHTRPLDSRIQIDSLEDQGTILKGLERLKGPRKYLLLNSRFYTPELLTDRRNIKPILDTLGQFVARGVIHGIVYCDHYLLQFLSDEAPELAAQLEAVPSVNTMLDSRVKIEAQLAYIGETGFKMPGKIILDRALNRDLDELAKIALQMHQYYPGMKLEVLANEGCLPYCPFKLSHDAYIALANLDGRVQTHALNCDIGCMRLLDDQPHRLLQSPFVRPEDIDLYLYHVDTIKLCGRTLGPDFLMNAISAYRARRYDGNLLDLMDAMSWLAERLYVDKRLPLVDFSHQLSMCDNRCEPCGFCKELFESISHPLSLSLQDMREPAIDRAGPHE